MGNKYKIETAKEIRSDVEQSGVDAVILELVYKNRLRHSATKGTTSARLSRLTAKQLEELVDLLASFN